MVYALAKKLSNPARGCHRMLHSLEPFLKYAVSKLHIKTRCKNPLGINFKSTRDFSSESLDKELIEAIDLLKSDKRKRSTMRLGNRYHEGLLKKLPKYKNKNIVFLSSVSKTPSKPGAERFANDICVDFFHPSNRFSTDFLPIFEEYKEKQLLQYFNTKFFPISPWIYPVVPKTIDNVVSIVHGFPELCEEVNSFAEFNKLKPPFGKMVKNKNTLRQASKVNHDFSVSYFEFDKRFENAYDTDHRRKQKIREVNRTLLQYVYAGLIHITGIKKVNAYVSESSYENKVMKNAAKMANADYLKAGIYRNVKDSNFELGISTPSALRILKNIIIPNLYDNHDPVSPQQDLFSRWQ